MTTDREYLELAAKAAGIDHMGWAPAGLTFAHRSPWNPLTDDGDALRLAVRLGLHIQLDTNDECLRDGHAGVEVTAFGDEMAHGIEQPVGRDSYAATRRAIVRAAAEIGKEMK